MASSADLLARKLAEVGPVTLVVGTYVSVNADGTLQVDFGSGEVTVLSSMPYQPLTGTSIRCLQLKGGVIALGEAAPTNIIGTVTATGTPYLTVTTSVGSQQLPYLASYTPVVSDSVVVIGGYVIGKPSTVLAGSYSATTSAEQEFQVDFRANDSGTYYVPGGSYSTSDVWCTSTGNNVGAWFYGTTIADTIPDTATILSVEVKVTEFYNEFPSSLALIGMHTLTTKSGAPTVTDSVTISSGSGWKTLPASFGDSLKDGTKRGVGTGSSGSSGYHKFRSRASDADSGLLRIRWRA